MCLDLWPIRGHHGCISSCSCPGGVRRSFGRAHPLPSTHGGLSAHVYTNTEGVVERLNSIAVLFISEKGAGAVGQSPSDARCTKSQALKGMTWREHEHLEPRWDWKPGIIHFSQRDMLHLSHSDFLLSLQNHVVILLAPSIVAPEELSIFWIPG
jgi:hypothetical protein